jgi:uncharacterized caspase-like protein
VAKKLADLGFEVLVEKDASRDAMTSAMGRFIKTLDGADVGLFYYAGHGIQYEGRNFLIGTDASIDNQFAVSSESLALDEVIAAMESVSATNLIFLDACRDNPFVDKLKASLPPTRSSVTADGLAPIKPQQGRDTMIVYATAANNVASDGAGQHSPFADALLEHVGTPGVEVSLMVKRVIQSVRVTTEYQQNPEILSGMAIEFYFAGPEIAAAPVTVTVAPATLGGGGPATPPEAAAMEGESLPASGVAAAPATPRASGTEEAEEPAGFDKSLLAALDVDQALADGQQEIAANLTPEQIEAALELGTEDVQRIQTALNAMGYDLGTADGEFGAKSREALKQFQVVNRVPQSGYLDQKTIEAILKAFDEAPKTYQGEWKIEIRRKLTRNDPGWPDMKPGDYNHLATLNLTYRNGELLIDRFQYMTILPDEPFTDFTARIDDTGRLVLRGLVSTHFRDANNPVAKNQMMTVETQLPRIMPFERTITAEGNRFEPPVVFEVTIKRVRT